MKKKIYLLLFFLCFGILAENSTAAASSYQPKVSRIAGRNRRDTAIEVSKFIKNEKRVVIARDDHYADALSGSSFEGNSPVFLLRKGIDPAAVIQRIREINPEEILILGAESAVSKEQEQNFIDVFGKEKVIRIAGKNRYETSFAVAKASRRQNFMIASGENFPDALTAGALASQKNAGILLSRQSTLPLPVKNYLAPFSDPALIGGEAALSSTVEKDLISIGKTPTRISGSNRYETAVSLAETAPSSEMLFIASGENYPDALAASSLASQYKAPILLSPMKNLPASAAEYIKKHRPKEVILLGGEAALSKNIEAQIKNIDEPIINHTAKEGGYIKITKDAPLYKDKTKSKTVHTIAAGKFAYVYKIEGSYLYLKQDGKSGYTNTLAYTTMMPYQESTYIPGPFISQVYPVDIPMGCESASALMALKRKGYALETTLPEFVSALPKASRNPDLGFVGDPYKVVSGYYMTIHPKPLTQFANSYGKAQDLSGSSLDYLRMEILNGNPVVLWGTYQFNNPVYFKYWNGKTMATGIDNAHVVLLAGYDGKTGEYIIADPYNPKAPKESWEYRVKEENLAKIYHLQKYAMVIR